jgi:eukaryotic-like serine/threonine-protein kinase
MAADPPKGAREEERSDPLAATVRERRRSETIDSAGPTLAHPSAPGPGGTAFGRGERLAHFIVVDRIGEGGMGTVVSAYDPDLDRKVAVKVLRADLHHDDKGSAGQQRLMREAQAMARLSHPNVVAVHEVGTVNDRVFIAMEFIDGQTLGAWLGAEKRSWREIVAVFVQAGQGLAAAHAAGLVHRDFKPDNVLVRKDGRVVVTDFGLAAASAAIAPDASGTSSEAREERALLASRTPLAEPLTREGVLLGTPAYMAPEQYGKTRVDAKADQFSFCVALYEALYGERPFQGGTLWELMGNVALGKRRPLPAASPVPPWVRDAVLKGLAPDPEARHASMAALLEVLSSDLGAKRRRRLAIAALAVGFAALAVLAVVGLLDDGDGPPCRTGRQDLAGVWDGATRTTLRAAFTKTRRPNAAETVVKVEQLLDDYATAWAAMRNEACEATEVKHKQSQRVLTLRMQCLDRRRAHLAALTSRARQDVDATVIDHAVAAARDLTAIPGCADTTALGAAAPLPRSKAARARLDALRRRIYDADVLAVIGRAPQALPVATAAVAEARQLGYRPVLADALHVLGQAQRAAGDGQAAAASLEQAARLAVENGAHKLAARIWIELLYVVGVELGRPADAAPIRSAAEAAMARAGEDELLQARLAYAVGEVLRAQGQHEPARQHLEQALAIRERRLGAEHPDLAEPLEGLAALLSRDGKLLEAADRYQRAVHIRIATLGPNHPSIPRYRLAAAEALRRAGKLADARHQLDRAATVAERANGAEHPDVATALVGLGRVLTLEDQAAEAVPHLERALRLRTAAQPGTPLALAEAQLALAQALPERERARALELATDARAAFAKAGPAGAKELAEAEAWLKRKGR